MKLYFKPGACSMAPHIALREAGISFEPEKVDLARHQTAAGEDYLRINPKGYVPALQLDDGSILTEAGVVLQYIADLAPAAGLAPRTGTLERYRLMEWLNFLSTEVHKTFSPFFNPKAPPEIKEYNLRLLTRRLAYLDTQLDGRSYVTGDRFTVADCYLFTLLNWCNLHQIELAQWPALKDYMGRIAARPSVRETMKAEGLIN
ncbi:MAG: glutathione transferase GstA [Gammaproteobacteria bacterium]|nr:glutathione transferase GstA [Gammaproteobacteria bacterium]